MSFEVKIKKTANPQLVSFLSKKLVFGDKLRSDDSLNYLKNSDTFRALGSWSWAYSKFRNYSDEPPTKISHCKIWQILWRGPNSSSNLENDINTSREDYYVILAVILIPVPAYKTILSFLTLVILYQETAFQCQKWFRCERFSTIIKMTMAKSY